MGVAIVIPARLDSTRLPRKALAEIEGRPMVQWVWEAACGAVPSSSVWVASDAAEILEAVERFGGQGILTGGHHCSGTDRVAEAAEHIDADVIVNLQGDMPLIPPTVLRALVSAFLADTAPMGTLMTPLVSDVHNPARVKVVTRQDGRALYFSRAAIPHPGGGAFMHLGVYVYRRDFLRTFTRLPRGRLEAAENLEQLRALEHGFDIAVVAVDYDGQGVDTPDDLTAARALARAVASRG